MCVDNFHRGHNSPKSPEDLRCMRYPRLAAVPIPIKKSMRTVRRSNATVSRHRLIFQRESKCVGNKCCVAHTVNTRDQRRKQVRTWLYPTTRDVKCESLGPALGRCSPVQQYVILGNLAFCGTTLRSFIHRTSMHTTRVGGLRTVCWSLWTRATVCARTHL